ncbi:parallel beta-helix repeat (two copies) [Mucilaginibacter pineti]|uniref:Parallel beta-helix repeat (Two copies) n=1 Tax=Mucilaginibacter pineti TaxID=1391627 RepID=A0A1G7CQW3_9SPHI|nr:right-handed parallel beta-helix repeat-containing protein [Mucilaginibacter pineti]SDE41718.1 parallel beta-helix repeat (two copies) [Mucilaginibacter pineti]
MPLLPEGWVPAGLTPTYINATSFSFTGNQTAIVAKQRRVRASLGSAYLYGYVVSAVYSTVTTVTVKWDSGSLTSALSAVDMGISDSLNTDIPQQFQYFLNVKDPRFGAVGNGTTDDTAAINNAVAYLNTYGGGKLFFPAGTYRVSLITVTTNITIEGEGIDKTIIKRTDSATGGVLLVNARNLRFTAIDITFDGNRTNNTNQAHTVTVVTGVFEVLFERCRFTGGKGYGVGLNIGDNNSNKISNGLRRISMCQFDNNDGYGLQCTQENHIHLLDNEVFSNNSGGVSISWYVFPPVTGSQQNYLISRNKIYSNQGSGLFILGYYTGGTAQHLIYGPRPSANLNFQVDANQFYLNSSYGLAVQADGAVVTNNLCYSNGVYGQPLASVVAGILCNSAGAIISGNICKQNTGYGIDAGGTIYSTISGNYIVNNAAQTGGGFIGLNVGACQHSIVSGNVLENNGGASGVQIDVPGSDGAADASFDQLMTAMKITGNQISLSTATQIGIDVRRLADLVTVENNTVNGFSDNNNIIVTTPGRVVSRGNTFSSNGYLGALIPSAATLIIPDAGEYFVVTGTTAITDIRTFSQQTYYRKVLDIQITNGGSGYSPASPPVITISGGGGSGATAIADVSNSGKVVSVHITNPGSGYTSLPAITITGGGGTGASGTAVVGCNNTRGRNFTLLFLDGLTINSGNNIVLPVPSIAATAGSCMSFIGQFNILYQTSRTS